MLENQKNIHDTLEKTQKILCENRALYTGSFDQIIKIESEIRDALDTTVDFLAENRVLYTKSFNNIISIEKDIQKMVVKK